MEILYNMLTREVNRMKLIAITEHNLTFHGHPGDAKRLAEHLRELEDKAGMNMVTYLNDWVFALEVAYQEYKGKDQDDWER